MNKTQTKPKLLVRGLWKIYGPGADSIFAGRETPPTDEELLKHNLFGAVRGASFEIWPGELITVMGLSGSGKSTLVRTVSRLIEPTYGQVWIDDEDLLAASPKRLIELRRHRMGMVFQNYALLPHRTVLENVALPLEVRGESKAKREERARQMVELVGLKDRIEHFPTQLSGGQQQRVGIARSLAVDPDIWFLDEPFSALDPLIRHELQEELLRLQKIVKKTILFITHDFDEAIRLANRIVIMEGGRIVQIGTPEDIVLNPKDDYIANFTKNVRRANVISIGSLAKPIGDVTGIGTTVPATARVIDVAEKVLAALGPVGVVDATGAVIGAVTREVVIAVLLERPAGATAA
ncbi:glycine betaine/L-proline ABC transporter ATP-binding protein [Hyphomicrobium sp. 99]|uniref:quaternary amine ABC transporter ATP-binding protein n=1 Tax=Hyphomicrobium sp. 99 TaxID=1163419 RepID=UPI0005F83415|nr:ATP-binding cassette domain-containing protein [Hyphomicrobium sp. 99]